MKKIYQCLRMIESWLQRIDRDKIKEDARKIGSALFGATFIGFLTNNMRVAETIVAIIVALLFWFYGVTK